MDPIAALMLSEPIEKERRRLSPRRLYTPAGRPGPDPADRTPRLIAILLPRLFAPAAS